MCTNIFSKRRRRRDSILSFYFRPLQNSRSHSRQPIQLMRTVNKEDKLLGRAANPRTGLVTPTEGSVLTGESNQNEARPRIDPVARQRGSWKRSENGWHRVGTPEQLAILQNGHPNEDLTSRYQHDYGRLDLVDPATPPTPPDSASLSSLEGFRIQRKPVGSGSKQNSPTCAIVEKSHTDIQKSHRPINTGHQNSGRIVVAYPAARLSYPPRPQSPFPRTLHKTTSCSTTTTASKRLSPDQAHPEARIAASRATEGLDNIKQQQSKSPLRTRSNDSDVLMGWNIPSAISKSTTATLSNRHNGIHPPHVQPRKHAVLTIVPPIRGQSNSSPKTIPAVAANTFCKQQSDHHRPRRIFIVPRVSSSNVNQKANPEPVCGGVHPTTTATTSVPAPVRPSPPQVEPAPLPAQTITPETEKSCKVLVTEVSLLLVQYNALRSLLHSSAIKWHPIAFLRHVFHMLYHIVKTLVGPPGSKTGEEDEAGILERNSLADLFWCLVYSIVLFWGLRLLILCIIWTANFIQVFVTVLQWIV